MSETIFSYTATKILLVSSIMVVIFATIFVVIFGVTPNDPKPSPYGGMEYPATLEAMVNSCGNIFYNPPEERNYGVIPQKFYDYHEDAIETKIPAHTMMVPVFGWMDEEGLTDEQIRFYSFNDIDKDFSKEKLFKTMYDKNITVIWYTKDLAEVDINLLKDFANQHPGEVFVHPWIYNDSFLVGGRSVAYSKWGVSQTCGLHNADVLNDFLTFVNEHPVERPQPAPEAELTPEGELYPIVQRSGLDVK